MALQVWLPLRGDLKNQGLSNQIPTSTAYSSNDNGKIGKCIKTATNSSIDLGYNGNRVNSGSISFGGWFKFNKTEIEAITSEQTYDSTYKTCTGNLIGNDSYGGVGLIWQTNDLYSGSFDSIKVFSCLRTANLGAKSTSAFTISFDTWTHLFLTFDFSTRILSLWVNGQLKYTVTSIATFDDAVSRNLWISYPGVWGGNARTPRIPFYINDLRIYDHCLSPKEIKEISKGLVLYYKLDDYIGKNLVNNCINITKGWGIYASVNSLQYEDGKVKAIAASSGTPRIYNSTILPYADEREYYTIYIDYICSANITVYGKSSNSTTVLNEAGAQTAGTITKLYQIDLGNNHKIAVFSWYRLAATDTIKSSWWMIVFSVNTTLYINSIKVEKGLNEQITWSPYDIEYLTVQDSSGYVNDGAITGTLSIDNDSPRYNHSTQFNSGDKIIPSIFPSFLTDECTVSMWVKLDQLPSSSPGRTMLYTAWYGFSCEVTSSGSTYFRTYLTNGQKDSPSGTLTINNWIHWVGVKSSTGVSLYLNGTLIGTSLTTDNFNWKSVSSNSVASYNNNYYLYGKLSDLKLYATALSAEDIKELHNTSAIVDNLGNDYCYQFEESMENIELNPSLDSFNHTSGVSQFDGKDLVFTGSGSSYSNFIEVDVSKTLTYDITFSNQEGSWFLIGFERYDENKATVSNSGCVYVTSATTAADHKRISGVLTLSNVNGNPCKFTKIRVLNCWSPQSTITGGIGKIHSFHFTQSSGSGELDITKQGQMKSGWFIEDEVLQSQISKNKYITANQLIEI